MFLMTSLLSSTGKARLGKPSREGDAINVNCNLQMKYLTQYRAAYGWFSGSYTSPPLLGEAEGAKGAEPAVPPSAQKQDSVLEVILILSKL